MAAPVPDAPRSSTGGMIPAEWSAQAADTVVETIAKVRDKTTRPAQIAARGLVYGIVVAVVGSVAAVFLMVILVRLLAYWVPGNIWWVYAGISVVFTGLGLFCLKKANRPAPTD